MSDGAQVQSRSFADDKSSDIDEPVTASLGLQFVPDRTVDRSSKSKRVSTMKSASRHAPVREVLDGDRLASPAASISVGSAVGERCYHGGAAYEYLASPVDRPAVVYGHISRLHARSAGTDSRAELGFELALIELEPLQPCTRVRSDRRC